MFTYSAYCKTSKRCLLPSISPLPPDVSFCVSVFHRERGLMSLEAMLFVIEDGNGRLLA